MLTMVPSSTVGLRNCIQGVAFWIECNGLRNAWQALMRSGTRMITGKKRDKGELSAESTSVGKRLAETNTLQAWPALWFLGRPAASSKHPSPACCAAAAVHVNSLKPAMQGAGGIAARGPKLWACACAGGAAHHADGDAGAHHAVPGACAVRGTFSYSAATPPPSSCFTKAF
jgi:hypothetical protein